MAEGVDPRDLAAYQAVERAYQEEVPQPAVDLADVVAHLEHVREVAGIDHVGLGGDYDGVDWLPEGLEDVPSTRACSRPCASATGPTTTSPS